jgi:hypothetical protein
LNRPSSATVEGAVPCSRFPHAVALLALAACGAGGGGRKPPAGAAAVAPVAPLPTAQATPPIEEEPPPPARHGEPTTGWYDGKVRVRSNTCEPPQPPPIIGVQHVRVEGGSADPELEQLSPAGHHGRSKLKLTSGWSDEQSLAPGPGCARGSKTIAHRVLAAGADGFDVERTIEYGDTSTCATVTTLPRNCRVSAVYTFTRRRGSESVAGTPPPPPAQVAERTKLAKCDVPLEGKKGPYASPPIDVQIRERIPYEPEAERCLDRIAPGAWARLEKRFPGITMSPVFSEMSAPDLQDMMDVARQRSGSDPGDLMLFFEVQRPASVNADALVQALKSEGFVQYAAVRPRAVPAGAGIPRRK